jgi:hypothetical protein
MYHPGSKADPDFYDHYKVSLANSGRIQVSLTRFPKELSPEFAILNANGGTIKSAYSTTRGSDLIESSEMVEAGDYIIRVGYRFSSIVLGGQGPELPEYATNPYGIMVSVLP